MHVLQVCLVSYIASRSTKALILQGTLFQSGLRRKLILLISILIPLSNVHCSVIEMSAGIIVCCMPTVNVVINRTVSSFKSRFSSPDPSLLPVHGPMTPQEDQGIIKDSGLGSTLANSSNSGHIWTSDEESPAWQASNNSSRDWQETSVSYPLKTIHKGPAPEQLKF